VESGDEIGCPSHNMTKLHRRQMTIAIDIRFVQDFLSNVFYFVRRQSSFVLAQSGHENFEIFRTDYSVTVDIC
jgi:hypothetical protein